ncbi:hypothetical protein IC774_03800 [Acinetobacter seifertii]|nr:hypothetical protein [Acinetobacter seifertii]QNX84385.1 hypothetical protein IC774_03800 [Acinetobacter seifertii]
MFNVHQADSVNKSEKLGEEKVGYRSVHFICDVGQDREKLPEFSVYKGLCFEIQIRTALEHAWAEIEHDRGYKLGGKLPSHLNRRFKLLSGLLESADLEFNRLTQEIEEYANGLKENIANITEDFELSTIGVKTLLESKYPEFISRETQYIINDLLSIVIKELVNFGINNLKQLDQEISSMVTQYNFSKDNTEVGFLRSIMMQLDLERYFLQAYTNSSNQWGAIDKSKCDVLLQKYSENEISTLFKEHRIEIE